MHGLAESCNACLSDSDGRSVALHWHGCSIWSHFHLWAQVSARVRQQCARQNIYQWNKFGWAIRGKVLSQRVEKFDIGKIQNKVSLKARETRTHCRGNIANVIMFRKCWVAFHSRNNYLCTGHEKMFHTHFLCPLGVQQCRYVSSRTATSLDTMLPPQCVLVLPGPKLKLVFTILTLHVGS